METGITVRAQRGAIVVSIDGDVDGDMMQAVCRAIVALDVPVVLDVSAIQITNPHLAIAIGDAAGGDPPPSLAVVAARLPARRILRRWTAGTVGIHATVVEALTELAADSGPATPGRVTDAAG